MKWITNPVANLQLASLDEGSGFGVVFPPREGEDVVLVSRVIDGDSVAFFYLVPDTARLAGIDAPEVTGKSKPAGLAAADYLRSLLPASGTITARFRGRDKYGRALLDLVLPDGRTASEAMVQAGHAREWDGTGER